MGGSGVGGVTGYAYHGVPTDSLVPAKATWGRIYSFQAVLNCLLRGWVSGRNGVNCWHHSRRSPKLPAMTWPLQYYALGPSKLVSWSLIDHQLRP